MKVANEIEKYYNFADVLEKEKGFSIALISRFVDALARRAAQNHKLTYDEEALEGEDGRHNERRVLRPVRLP